MKNHESGQTFTKYLKNNLAPDKIDLKFNEVKQKIMSK